MTDPRRVVLMPRTKTAWERPAQPVVVRPVSPFGTLADIEQRAISNTLRFYGGNKPAAANALGISLKSLYDRLKRMQT